MNSENHSFPSRRIWFVAILVAPFAVVIEISRIPTPTSLFSALIIIGVSLILVLEVLSKIIPTSQSNKFLVWLFPEVQPRNPTVVHVESQDSWPKTPDVFIEPDPDFIQRIDSNLATDGRLVLTGKQGAGKTTYAVALCRRYEEMNGHAPIAQEPVFISISQDKRTNGISTLFMDRVADHLAINHPNTPSSNAKRMLGKGSLLLVIDDLDYLGKRDQEELHSLITKWKRNSFLCIISEVRQDSFLAKDFVRVEMPEWEPKVVRSYIADRIKDEDKKNHLIESLEQSHILDHALLPWQANFLVEECLEGRFYKLLTLGNLESDLDYKILDDWLSIIMKNANPEIQYRKRIEVFGKLALDLIKEGRSNFIPEKVQIPRDQLNGLISKVFQEQGNGFVFVHGNYQVFLAGRYIAEFWPETKSALQGDEAKAYIWKPVYSCARQFMPPESVNSLDEAFGGLGQEKEPQQTKHSV